MHILDGGGEGGGCGALEAAADEGKLADSRFRRRECRDERDCTKVAKVALLQKDAGDVPGSGGGRVTLPDAWDYSAWYRK